MAYDIDDIYTAAVNGDTVRLKEYLELGEVDINQMLDGGISNGLHASFPMLFSVLNHMRQNGINYEILDMLVRYGIDLDGKVKLSCDAFTRYIPFLNYIMLDWSNVELTRALLERGACPNNIKEEYYSDGHAELYCIAQAAIFWYGHFCPLRPRCPRPPLPEGEASSAPNALHRMVYRSAPLRLFNLNLHF